MKKTLLILIVAAITGCAESSTLTKASQYPTLDRTNTLAGIDVDKNGVRDDIDNFIKSQNLPEKEESILISIAKAKQKAITIDIKNESEVNHVKHLFKKSSACFLNSSLSSNSKLYRSQISVEIERYSMNTKMRLKAYMLFMKKMDGEALSLNEFEMPCE